MEIVRETIGLLCTGCRSKLVKKGFGTREKIRDECTICRARGIDYELIETDLRVFEPEDRPYDYSEAYSDKIRKNKRDWA